MTRHAAHWSLVGFVGLLLYMNTGCTRSIELKPASVHSQSADTHLLANDERVPLVMDSFHLSRNGAPQNPRLKPNGGFSIGYRRLTSFRP